MRALVLFSMQLLILIKLKGILICLVNTDESIDSEDVYGGHLEEGLTNSAVVNLLFFPRSG